MPDPVYKIVEYLRQLVPLIDGELGQLQALGFELQPLESLLDVLETALGQLAALGEMTLVIVAVLAANQDDAVDAAR